MDGQISLNHLATFTFEIVRRLFNESIAKANNSIGKLRLQNTLEKLSTTYQSALQGLRLMAQNMDFAQLTIQANIAGGPNGIVALTLRDIVAQAPLLLSLSIMKDKNLGVLPLVPYIIAFKPQDNGDVYLEVCLFSCNVTSAWISLMWLITLIDVSFHSWPFGCRVCTTICTATRKCESFFADSNSSSSISRYPRWLFQSFFIFPNCNGVLFRQ